MVNKIFMYSMLENSSYNNNLCEDWTLKIFKISSSLYSTTYFEKIFFNIIIIIYIIEEKNTMLLNVMI